MKCILFITLVLCSLFSHSQILNFSNFHTPAQVDAAMTQLQTTYPTKARVITIGNSLGGLPIKALKISANPMVNDPLKGDVVFVAEHHAREWISVEVALYLADQLLARYSTDMALRADMDNLQIYIVPTVNPDGYQHTQTAGNRFWRKNRRNNGDGTFGVDLNRNWGYQWGLSSGSSPLTSEDTYRGTAAFSEPETVVMRDFLNGLANLKSFVSYHSYSELYLRPWSYTTSDPPGESTLRSIAQRNIGRIAAVHGHTYTEEIWYTSSGEATDYVWQEKRVAAFTPELRPSSGGITSFAPPPGEIIPCAEENFPAARALIHDAARTGIWIKDSPGDTGAEPSTGAFWISPDIWTDPVDLVAGSTVDLHIRVRNNTGVSQSNVTVDAYFTDPRIALEFPSATSVSIATRTITVPAAGTEIVVPWTVPAGRNSWGELHWCVGVVLKQADDMPLTTVINRTSNIACKNFETREVISGAILTLAATNFLSTAAELQVTNGNFKLPPGFKYEVLEKEIKREKAPGAGTQRKGKLLKATGILLEPGESIQIPIRITFDGNLADNSDFTLQGNIIPLVAGKREVISNGYTYSLKSRQ